MHATAKITLFIRYRPVDAGRGYSGYSPGHEKTAAIVTEQGGVTSRAAIVSRELNIPCVFGTKIATRVLKDGDRVEVDAIKV
jgi:phosphohistidine swiveling domain-containing protein